MVNFMAPSNPKRFHLAKETGRGESVGEPLCANPACDPAGSCYLPGTMNSCMSRLARSLCLLGAICAWPHASPAAAPLQVTNQTHSAAGFQFDWTSQGAGTNYTVQYRDDLVSGPDWQPMLGAPHNDGFLLVTNTAPQRFYRLLITGKSFRIS